MEEFHLTEESTDPKSPPSSFDDLKKKIDNKKHVDTQVIIAQIATREKLERDYKEDILDVVFYSSPGTQRKIKAKRPTQSEMMTIMRLSAEAAIYEGRMDTKSLAKMVDIYEKLPELAANLSVDKTLNPDFWKNKVSFATLQNFITEVIKETQKGTGAGSEELKSFR